VLLARPNMTPQVNRTGPHAKIGDHVGRFRLRRGPPVRISDRTVAAERVGVAAAVTPQATSQPPGGAMDTLKIGESVVYNERIATSGTGVVQVLLVDGSTFTVGPKSNLVIDKSVYNPKTGTDELVASFSKGALRFVGGKLSKGERALRSRPPPARSRCAAAFSRASCAAPIRRCSLSCSAALCR
jgi:hypothetical protein